MREAAAEFERPVLLYSVGKDSSVLLHLALKAFAPGRVPFPFLHVDTGFKFQEMYAFRDQRARDAGIDLRVWRNEPATAAGANPFALGTERCCGLLKTEALLTGLAHLGADAAIGGARRDEERSRAKERVFSVRSASGQWDPRQQRPELWNLYNAGSRPGESMRVFPLSNWTELTSGTTSSVEGIAVDPLYFAASATIVERGGQLLMLDARSPPAGPTPPAQTRELSRSSAGSAASAACRAAARCARRRTTVPRSSRRCRPRGSRSAVRASSTTTATRRWNARSAKGISDVTPTGTACASARLGSVDDGKSTLIGRLLHDTHSSPRRSDRGRARPRPATAPAGLRLLAAHRRPARPSASRASPSTSPTGTSPRPSGTFIVADMPGHEQYTRNMATGASTAHLALLLVDAPRGVLPQTRRHAFIAIAARHPAPARRGEQDGPRRLCDRFSTPSPPNCVEFAARLGPHRPAVVPVVARDGDNWSPRRRAMPWYSGESVLELLESVYVGGDREPRRPPAPRAVRDPRRTTSAGAGRHSWPQACCARAIR